MGLSKLMKIENTTTAKRSIKFNLAFYTTSLNMYAKMTNIQCTEYLDRFFRLSYDCKACFDICSSLRQNEKLYKKAVELRNTIISSYNSRSKEKCDKALFMGSKYLGALLRELKKAGVPPKQWGEAVSKNYKQGLAKSCKFTPEIEQELNSFYGKPFKSMKLIGDGTRNRCICNAVNFSADEFIYIGCLVHKRIVYPHAFNVVNGIVHEHSPIDKGKYLYYGKIHNKSIKKFQEADWPECIKKLV